MQKHNSGSGGLRCAVATLLSLLGLGAVVLIGGTAWALTHLPQPSAALPMALNLARVSIIQPVNGESLALDEPIKVYAKAFGDQPIQDVQLYVDGKLIGGQAADFPAGALKATASWNWKPSGAGEHVLTARVQTADGKGNVSNAVVVKGLAADQFPSFTSLAGIGDAIPTLEPGEIEAMTAGGAPAPPPPGAGDAGGGGQNGGSVPAEEPPIPPPAQEPADKWLPISIDWWFHDKFGDYFPLSMPEAPQINGLANGCDSLLIVKDNAESETGFFLYRLDPGKFVFERAATLDGKDGKQVFSYHDPGLASGTYFYYLAAFNKLGEAPSNVVAVKVEGPVCDAALPPVFDPGSIPVDPAQPVDKMYCYGSAHDMPWVRLPTGQDNFLAPANGKFDLALYWKLIPLPAPLPPKFMLNMECWGWSGETLVYLGASSKEFITAKEQKKQQQEPQIEPTKAPAVDKKAKISAPYNLHHTSDFQECKSHIPATDDFEIESCEEFLGFHKSPGDPGNFHSMLVWDWDKLSGCDPIHETCDMVEHYLVYRIRNGAAPLLLVYKAHPYKAFPLDDDPLPEDEYFIQAYKKSPLLISPDSNHIVMAGAQKLTLTPASLINYNHLIIYKAKNGVVQTPAWKDSWQIGPSKTDSVMGGYWRKMSQDLRTYNEYYGKIKFDLPKDKYILSAKLAWVWTNWKTEGPGKAELGKVCGLYISDIQKGSKVISESIWSDTKEYNVSGAVGSARSFGWDTVDFWLTQGPTITSQDLPNTCLVIMKNIRLILEVSDFK